MLPNFVIPAKAEIQFEFIKPKMDSRFRGNDGVNK